MKFRDAVNHIHNVDCIKGMRGLRAASVDLVITDPPFAIDFKSTRRNYHRKAVRVMDGYNEIDSANYPAFTLRWMSQAHRLLKESGALFVFSGWNNLKDILVAADELGFITVNHLIWKYQFGVVCKRRFVTSHYHCLYLCKDEQKRKFFHNARFGPEARTEGGGSRRYRDMEDVWEIPREYWYGDIKTPTKLPAEIIRKILAYTSEPGDVVLDPFVGSGQVPVICRELGRQYLGFEIVPEYHAFATRRLEEDLYRIPHSPSKPRK